MRNFHSKKSLAVAISLVTLSLFSTLRLTAAQANENWPALLAKNPGFFDFTISPDGKHLAAKIYRDGRSTLVFFDSSTMQTVGAASMGGLKEVGDYRWVNNERVVFKLVESKAWEKQPFYYGELFGVNIDGSRSQLLFGYQAGDEKAGSRLKTRESRRAWAEFIDTELDEDNQILIMSTPADKVGAKTAEILKMNVYTGKTIGRGKVPVSYANVLVGSDGVPKVVTGTNKKNETEVYIRSLTSNEWEELPRQQFGSAFTPIAVTNDNKAIYVYDNKEQDKSGVFKLDLASGKYEAVYTDPMVDVTMTSRTADNRSVYGLRVDDGFPAYALLTSAFDEANVFKKLLATFPGEVITITSSTKDGKKWLAAVSSDINPGTYYLYDHDKVSLTKLADRSPHLAGKTMAMMEPVKFPSFDGKEIHGYLTLTEQQSAAKPMVVLVHGGPHGVRDYWGFDSEVQLLAKSGYNVLQVNYRGSDGYGANYKAAGYLQWGDAIQKDIIAGTEWAIAQGHAKAGNVCIMGGSFGGYSVVQAATIKPELYRCGVAVAGIYDLTLMTKLGDIPRRGYGKAFLQKVIGNDPAQLAAFSPVNRVEQLKAHLLIAHGRHDERAPMEHATALKKALEKAGKPYEWLEFADETHGFYSESNQQIYFTKVQQYLAQHLTK
jgi:dipeptidyl aminopeptidase/acylaminoacyl peptidase